MKSINNNNTSSSDSSTDKDSKISQDTINSTRHHHILSSHLYPLHHAQLDDGSMTVSGLINPSLSYNCLANNMNSISAQTGGLFLPGNNNTNTHKPNCMLAANNTPLAVSNQDDDSYNFLNQTNMRRSIFMTNNFQKNQPNTLLLPSNTLIMPRTLTSNSGINKFNNQNQFAQCLKLNANNTSQTANLISNDPLGHIYETISVSSASNGGFNNNNNMSQHPNKYKTNSRHVESAKVNAYNDLEFDYKLANQQQISIDNQNTSLSLTESIESGQSPKSQELFLISSNNNNTNTNHHHNTRKSMSRKSNHRLNNNNNNNSHENNLLTSQQQMQILPNFIQQQQQQTLFKQTNSRNVNRLSEMNIQNAMNQSSQNLINNNSPPSCSSSITTTTTGSSFDSSCPILQQQNHHQSNNNHNSRYFVGDHFSNFNINNSINCNSFGGQIGFLSHHQQQQQHQPANQFHMINENSDAKILFASRSEAVV
jgi:hypothetical protein